MKPDKLIRFLSQPYPFYYEGRFPVAIVTIIYLMSFAFSYFFEPFNVNPAEHKLDYFWVCQVHALTSALVLMLMIILITRYKGIEERWTVLKEVLFLAIVLLLIGVGQFLIRDIIYDNPNNWSLAYFLEEIGNTFLVGVLFIIIIVPLNFNRLYFRHLKKAGVLNRPHPQPVADGTSDILIETQVKSETFTLPVADFLFARANGNYSEIFIATQGRVEKLFKRIAIKDLATKLQPAPLVVQTHRAYVVNLHKVVKVTGNAQGYKLHLENWPDPVPVSRNIIPVFEQKMASLRA